MKLLARLLLNALFLLFFAYLLKGVSVSSFYIAIIVSLVLGFLNAVVRPFLVILTLPINILTLGFFTLILNGLLVLFVASFVQGFLVANLWSAVLLSLCLWLGSLFTNLLLVEAKN